MQRLHLAIEGMSCGHCVASVRRALAGVDGVDVQDVQVGSATVSYDPARVRPETLTDAVRDEGYDAHATGA